MAGVSLVAALGAVLVLTRPQGPATVAERAREEAPAARVAGEPPPAVDDEHAYAPGSPGAVAERFLRAFWRAHYVDAAALATGETLARCQRDQRAGAELPPEHAELYRRVRVFREASRYRLRRSTRDDHFCTSEVAALCLDLAGEPLAAQTLEAYLDVFTHHYLRAKNQLPVQWDGEAHARLCELAT